MDLEKEVQELRAALEELRAKVDSHDKELDVIDDEMNKPGVYSPSLWDVKQAALKKGWFRKV